LRKFETGKRGSEKLFPLFPFSNLLYFFILSNAKVSKNKYAVEKEKENGGFSGCERKLKCKWWKKDGKENGITIGLPPSKASEGSVQSPHWVPLHRSSPRHGPYIQ
jgi:hypothetical protein